MCDCVSPSSYIPFKCMGMRMCDCVSQPAVVAHPVQVHGDEDVRPRQVRRRTSRARHSFLRSPPAGWGFEFESR